MDAKRIVQGLIGELEPALVRRISVANAPHLEEALLYQLRILNLAGNDARNANNSPRDNEMQSLFNEYI